MAPRQCAKFALCLRETLLCFKCHADKQGPFVYEHVPVKTEGCTSCHTPHGSTNPRLLRVSQVNLLCLQCHTFPMQGPAGPTTIRRLNKLAHCATRRFTGRMPAVFSSNEGTQPMFYVSLCLSAPRTACANWSVRHLASGFLLLFLISGTAHAQGGDAKAGQDQPQPPEGMQEGGYTIHFSVEAGYRLSDVTGSQGMYSTLVNLPSGPRTFDQSLSMQSPAHDGLLFDNLFFSSNGWGGDPNQGWNLRMDKGRLYDFRASYRRDQNSFDYDLLTNPLNPPTSSPSIPVTDSPHTFLNHRRMSDFDLAILPQSAVTIRIGYSNNNMKGPSFSSVHEGTDALLSQVWDSQLNSYRFGVDIRPATRTVISYDQSFDVYDGNTAAQLAAFAPAIVPPTPGIPATVELGLPIDTANRNPCAINHRQQA